MIYFLEEVLERKAYYLTCLKNFSVDASSYICTDHSRVNLFLKFFNYSANMDQFVTKFHLQKLSFLREFCKKTGVQILLREYDFNSKKNLTFYVDDIVNLFPVVKYATPKATDACVIFETAQARLQAGNCFVIYVCICIILCFQKK